MPARGSTISERIPDGARPAVELVPQPHGGALQRGGSNPGAGRPASAIREHLRGSFAERIAVLEAIADGEAMQTSVVPLAAVLRHARCPVCAGKLEALASDPDAVVKLEALVSAAPSDRVQSLRLMGEIGIGPDRVLTLESVKERLQSMLSVIRGAVTASEYQALEPRLRAVWTAE